jgi:hypothetical protein
VKDRDALLTFYDFPAEHWDHLRTSNPIESIFATVRHRTVRTKGALSQDNAQLMVFKLVTAASKTWRKLKGENQLPKVVNLPRGCLGRSLCPPSRPPTSRLARDTQTTRRKRHYESVESLNTSPHSAKPRLDVRIMAPRS